MHPLESSEGSKLAQIDINDLLYSIEIKMFKKYPVNEKRYDDKQIDKLAEFDETALAHEVKKRVSKMSKYQLDDYKTWVQAIRKGIEPNNEMFLDELLAAFEISPESKTTDAPSRLPVIHREVRGEVANDIDGIINPS
jgi:hypothetical protein